MVCEEVIPVLVSLLEDTDPEVQASATGALMFATVKPQGEKQRRFCWDAFQKSNSKAT